MIVLAESTMEDTPPERLGSWAWTKTAHLIIVSFKRDLVGAPYKDPEFTL